jgi:DNA-directed RNA polymerase specialized sigma subunit
VVTAPTFSLSGADLSIQPSPDVVLRDHGDRIGGLATQVVMYVAGFVLIAIALIDRKRKDIPLEVLVRRKNLRIQRARIEEAKNLARQQAAEEIAAAIRAMVAEMPDVTRDDAHQLIANCESLIYAPSDNGEQKLDDNLIQNATAVADRYLKEAG